MATVTEDLQQIVGNIVNETRITDVHTHLFAPHFGELLLAGVDELITYHYLIAESMRVSPLPYENFWNMTKEEQADFIWEKLFLENTPYSEACRGVVTNLKKLGMDLKSRDFSAYRKALANYEISEYVDLVFREAGVSSVVMTNDPFDEEERKVWLENNREDPRFHAALRIDPLLNDYAAVLPKLREWGFDVNEQLSGKTVDELRRFLSEWLVRMDALYVAVSLPDTFQFPEDSLRARLIEEVVVPVCREKNRPFAMMIGVKRQVNPDLKSAGDSSGKADIRAIEHICRRFPNNKFMVTMLSRENQHELAVTGRKFRNLMVFGCWWFLNNPTLVEEMTSMRFELLGSSVIPQHSDARILDQLIYKWNHSREIITRVLVRKYQDLTEAGWDLRKEEIQRDVKKMLNDNFWDFVDLKLPAAGTK